MDKKGITRVNFMKCQHIHKKLADIHKGVHAFWQAVWISFLIGFSAVARPIQNLYTYQRALLTATTNSNTL